MTFKNNRNEKYPFFRVPFCFLSPSPVNNFDVAVDLLEHGHASLEQKFFNLFLFFGWKWVYKDMVT
jgi:hypothetical protein